MLFVSVEVNHLLMLYAIGVSYCQSNANGVLGRLASGKHNAFHTPKSCGALAKLVAEGILFRVVPFRRRLEGKVAAERFEPLRVRQVVIHSPQTERTEIR